VVMVSALLTGQESRLSEKLDTLTLILRGLSGLEGRLCKRLDYLAVLLQGIEEWVVEPSQIESSRLEPSQSNLPALSRQDTPSVPAAPPDIDHLLCRSLTADRIASGSTKSATDVWESGCFRAQVFDVDDLVKQEQQQHRQHQQQLQQQSHRFQKVAHRRQQRHQHRRPREVPLQKEQTRPGGEPDFELESGDDRSVVNMAPDRQPVAVELEREGTWSRSRCANSRRSSTSRPERHGEEEPCEEQLENNFTDRVLRGISYMLDPDAHGSEKSTRPNAA